MTDENDTANVVQLEPKTRPKIPEFITPSDIRVMDDDELDAMVSAIRTRRLLSYSTYKAAKDEKDRASDERIQARIDTKSEQIIKDINATDKALERLEKHVNELRGLRLQAGLNVV